MEFFVRLDKANYGEGMGWPVPALGLPGAKSRRLLVDGAAVDLENGWVFEGGHLRSRDQRYRPGTDANLLVALQKPLVAVWVPVIASVAAALIGAATTLFIGLRSSLVDPEMAQLCREAVATLTAVEFASAEPARKAAVARSVVDRCRPVMEKLERQK
jgi:hypothetical protein